MKRTFKQLASMLLMVILFAVNSGFQLFSHMCFMGGGQTISTGEVSSCCASEQKPSVAVLESGCCDEDVHFVKMDITTRLANTPVQQDLFSIDLPDLFQDKFLSDHASLAFGFDEYPPPKWGRDMLSQHQVFRI